MGRVLFALGAGLFSFQALAQGAINPTAGPSLETWAGTLRRLAGAAKGNNPVELPRLIGSVPWAASTAYTASAGSFVSHGGQVYICITSGTSAANGGPTGRSDNITDNTAHWAWYGVQTAPALTVVNSLTHNAALTNIYPAISHLTDNTGVMRFQGGVPTQAAFTGYVGMASVNVSPLSGNLVGNLSTYHNSATTVLEGTELEIAVLGNNGFLSFIVDGQYIDWQPPVSAGGTPRFYILDFTNAASVPGPASVTGRARHTVTVEFSENISIYQMAVAPTDTVSYPPASGDFSVGMVGDSQLAGVGEVNALQGQSYAAQLMHLLGLPDISQSAIGGTGIVKPGPATNYAGHAIADLQNLNAFRPLKYIFVEVSANDNGHSGIQAAALSFFESLRTSFPSATIFVYGALAAGGNGSPSNIATCQTTENAYFAAVAQRVAAGDTLIFTIPSATSPGGSWIAGTGNDGAQNGTGNADFDIGPDNWHMSAAGHSLWARRLAAGVMAIAQSVP